jgi:hypothetical protein
MKMWRTGIVLLLAAAALAGCSGGLPGFGGPKQAKPLPSVDANLYPANYRAQVVIMMRKLLSNRADYQSAMIAPPALKPVPDSPNLHYVVCLQFNNRTEHRDKVVIYLGGEPQQYVDATPQECADAAYQPFSELLAALPSK